MAIKSVRIENFRSFGDFEINLGQFNVLVGANASGKSNLLQVFRFLEDIANHGLQDAISLQGGVRFLTNAQIGRDRALSLTIIADTDERYIGLPSRNDSVDRPKITWLRIRDFHYHFSLKFAHDEDVEIVRDQLSLDCEFSELAVDASGKPLEESIDLGEGSIVLRNTNGELYCDLSIPKEVSLTERDFLPPTSIVREEKSPASLLLERRFLHHPLFLSAADILMGTDNAIYDFDSRKPKQTVGVAGKSELESDGSNLALVLRRIISDESNHRKFRLLVQDILPFVEDLAVDAFADKWLLMTLKESYVPEMSFPATFISDGTINIIALIVALYFEEHSVVMIEEPERNIHPHLISEVVEMLKDKAEKKQILVTTHSPEVVQHAGLENLLLISRHRDGFSRVSRPSEKEAVRIFLENEIGIGDIYKHNLLER